MEGSAHLSGRGTGIAFEHPRWLRTLIIGGTPDQCRSYKAQRHRRVAEEVLEDIVIFTHHVSEMPKVHDGVDVVISATTSPEPLGIVASESMTKARPLVAPAHGGAAEMATHDQTTLLFEPGHAQDLARQIARLHDEPDTSRRLGEAAHRGALATFDVETHAEKVRAVYDRVLADVQA